MSFLKRRYRKMNLRIVMTLFFLCLRVSAGVKAPGEDHVDAQDAISGGKSLNNSVKVALDNEPMRHLHIGNKTAAPVKHKPADTSVITINEEKENLNETVAGTPRGNKPDSMNFGAVLRGFYVFLGLSVIVIMYFTVRAIRLGRKRTKVKKYGILASREDLEMTPLGAEDEEEDTIFDISSEPGR